MKWLQDNPFGTVLAAASGVFILLMLGMAIAWNLPVSVEIAETVSETEPANDMVLAAKQVAPMQELLVINERPVFNESRLPVVETEEDTAAEEDTMVEVKDAPDVRLTGVIITPGMKIASLTPANENLESVMAHEGEALTGEFVGWQVSTVNPRVVVLESRDGQTLELDLQVHDATIKQPPKPVKATTAQDESPQAEAVLNEDGEPMSRAEQIRQRIAERREELRLEQEAQNAPRQAIPGGVSRPKTSTYQNAIRNMMNNKPKEPGTDDDKDG